MLRFPARTQSPETLTAILPKKNLNMKIGTWNLERLKYYKKTAEITSLLESQNCDILVLTEYDERIKPKGFEFEISTKNVAEVNTEFYQVTEKRVKIFTKYEIIKHLPSNETLVKFNPVTGRTHQLRVHANYLNTPIKGDRVYGKSVKNERMYLHASELEITIPGGKRMTFTAETPKEFNE